MDNEKMVELRSDEYRELWNAVLYGIGIGSGEVVAVSLSGKLLIGLVSPADFAIVSLQWSNPNFYW